jgi:Protein of unknown function (DUF3987)
MKEVPRPKPDAYKSMDERIPPREKEHEPSSGDDPKPPGGFAQEGNNGSEQSAPWPEPQPLEDYLSPVLPMCREMMPDPLAEWAIDVSDQVRCPLDFVFSTALVMTSSVIATRVRIRPGHYTIWEITPNLWGAVVGPPGSKKTPATSEVLKMLDRLKIKEASIYDKEKAAYKGKHADFACELKALRGVIEKLRKQHLEGKSKPEHEERLANLKKQVDELLKNEPQPPVRHRYRINDPTIEALQDILKKDPRCILIERDELTGMLAQWEMDAHKMDRSFYLEAWNGYRPYDGERVVRGEFDLSVLCLSIFGGIQPVKLIHYLRDPKNNLTHDGAMQRLQLSVYPDPPATRKYQDQYENTQAKNRFFAILETLATADFHDFGAISNDFNKVPWFHFNIEAKKIFEDWLFANEQKTADKNEDPSLQEHFAKFPKLFCSLALIFHLIDLADRGKKETYIPVSHAHMALKCCDYLESHARRIYALARNPSLSSAICLAAKITDPKTETPLENGFTARDVFRRQWIGIDSYELVNAALARLEELHWIRPVKTPQSQSGGRPTICYNLNPSLSARRTPQ